MQKYKQDDGYTLVEMLVALTLLMILLFLSTKILGSLALNSQNDLKMLAIDAAHNQMENALLSNQFDSFEKELTKGLLLKQTVEKKETLRLITIEIIYKKSQRKIYSLSAYAKPEKRE